MRALIFALLLSACSWKARVKHLSNEEFDHYYALRVFMEESQQRTYLRLRTHEERDAYLQDLGLWDKFYDYPADVRELIVAGDVSTGWKKDQLYMAWGAPFDRKRLVGRQATRSELLTYRFEQHADGSVLLWEPGSKTEYKAVRLFVREVAVDDDVIAEITEADATW